MATESKRRGPWEVGSQGSEASVVRAVLREAEEPTGKVSFLQSRGKMSEEVRREKA